MADLDPRIEAVRAKYDLQKDDFWQIPQNRQWVCKHAALEIVATKANVEWSPPQIIQADTENGIAVLAVTGKMGSRIEWATGEASPKNNKNAYPWAMAEKRAKDRVVLKLAGIHGLVYSEDEMPSDTHRTVEQRPTEQRRVETAIVKPETNPAIESLWAEINAISSPRGIETFWKDNSRTVASMDEGNRTRFTDKKEELKNKFGSASGQAREAFPGSMSDQEALRSSVAAG